MTVAAIMSVAVTWGRQEVGRRAAARGSDLPPHAAATWLATVTNEANAQPSSDAANSVNPSLGRASGPLRLDVHTHFFPEALPDFAASTGDPRWPSLRVDDPARGRIVRGAETFRPVASTCWHVDDRAAVMTSAGIDRHVLSPVPITLVYWAEPKPAAEYARIQNELLAAAAASQPDRYLAFGGVALQDTDAAIVGLQHAHDLGLVGVEIGARVGDRELDDPELRGFFEAAESLGMALFVHPLDGGGGAIRRQGAPYDFGLGMLTDTALAATALVYGGVLERFPGLRVALAHGCGSFPWAYPRLARGATLGPGAAPLGSFDDLVRLLWADSLVFDPSQLAVLFARFGADHVMLGSDFPFYPPSFGEATAVIDDAAAAGLCSPDQATGMLGANALRFLGR